MPVSGLVLTFVGNVNNFPDSLKLLANEKEIELGQSHGAKLALVLDCSSQRGKEILQWLNDLPGVEHVDVTFVGLD